jgi:hypothetical protein
MTRVTLNKKKNYISKIYIYIYIYIYKKEEEEEEKNITLIAGRGRVDEEITTIGRCGKTRDVISFPLIKKYIYIYNNNK